MVKISGGLTKFICMSTMPRVRLMAPQLVKESKDLRTWPVDHWAAAKVLALITGSNVSVVPLLVSAPSYYSRSSIWLSKSDEVTA